MVIFGVWLQISLTTEDLSGLGWGSTERKYFQAAASQIIHQTDPPGQIGGQPRSSVQVRGAADLMHIDSFNMFYPLLCLQLDVLWNHAADLISYLTLLDINQSESQI